MKELHPLRHFPKTLLPAVVAALFLCLAALGLSGTTSCASYTPAFVLSLHEFADQNLSTRLSKQVRNANREWQYTIKNFSYLDARSFLEAEAYGPDEEGLYGLRIRVDKWSLPQMHHTAGSNLGLVFAVVLDGTYIGTSHFTPEMRDSDLLVIEPLFSHYDALKIVENMPLNQQHMTK